MGAPGTTPGLWAIHRLSAHIIPAAHADRPIGGAEDAAVDLATYAQEICAMHWPDRNRSEQEVRANAHQIAASGALYDALGGICSLIGNVDHSRGGGENAARMYGEMLNDIRDIASQAQALARGEAPHV